MKLAAEFGTSQMPVREALRDLEMAGLVTSKPRRGSFVKPFAASAQREIYLVRGALEEAAARLATAQLCRAMSAHSSAKSRACARRRGPENIERMIAHSVQFHRIIVAAAGNELLLKLWDSLHLEIHTRVTLLGARHRLHEGGGKPSADRRCHQGAAMSSAPAACRASIRLISSTGSICERCDRVNRRSRPPKDLCCCRRRIGRFPGARRT